MKQYHVTGMSCAACVARVEKAVSAVDGVERCAVSLLTNSMGVDGTASPEEIDEINILNASMLAMRRAVEGLSVSPEFLLVDGNIARGFDQPALAVIKGDAKSPSIAAASIIAKVLRDRECLKMDEEYPQYGFAGHKGYPTKAHFDAIEKHGVSPIHRKSFLKKRGLA